MGPPESEPTNLRSRGGEARLSLVSCFGARFAAWVCVVRPPRSFRRARLSSALAAGMVLGCAGGSRPEPPEGSNVGDRCPNDLPDGTDCPSTAPSYRLEVASVIERRCSVCHLPQNTQSTQVFADYADIHAGRRGMLTRIYGCQMPPEGAEPLAPEERGALLKWLVCGAPDN